MSQIECDHNRKRATELANAARRHSARGRYSMAEESFHKALRLLRNDTSNPECIALWNELGIVLKYGGKYDEAERCYQLALRHSSMCFGIAEQRFFRANVYHNLAGIEHSRERFECAARYARKGLELRLKCSTPDSLAVAADRAALGAILHGLSKFRDSEKNYRQALRIYRREYGASNPEFAVLLNNLAVLCHATGIASRAEYYFRAALRMKRKLLGRSHPDLAVTMNNVAFFFDSQGKTRTAQAWMTKALRILRSTLGSSHPTTVCVEENLLRIIQPN